MSNRRLTLLLGVIVPLALLLVGCGGHKSEQKANEAYASGVCRAIGSYLAEVKTLPSDLPVAGFTRTSIDAMLRKFRTDTRRFIAHVNITPVPNTPDGSAAKREIDQVVVGARAASSSAEVVTSTLAANPSRLQIVEALTAMTPTFEALKPKVQSSVRSVQSSGGSVASAFKSEPACKPLG